MTLDLTNSTDLSIVKNKTTVRIHSHNKNTGAQGILKDNRTWSPGWSFIRPFKKNGEKYLFLIKNRNGKARIMKLNSNGTVGDEVGAYELTKNVTSVEFLYPNNQPVLMLHTRQSGRVILWQIKVDGSLGSILSDHRETALRYKDTVLPYRVGGNWFLFGLDRWYGGATAFPLKNNGTLDKATEPLFNNENWTRGWSQAAFYRADNKTYLILYKTEHLHNLEQGGKIRVKRVLNDGTFAEGWHQKPGDGFWSRGYTQFKVLPEDNLLLIYKIHNGAAKILPLNATGIGSSIVEENLESGWTDLSAVRVGGKLHLIKVNEEGLPPFDYRMVRAFRDHVVSQFGAGKTVGYQFGLRQSGRIIHLHAEGWAHRSESRKMTTKSKQDVASVSKMITAATIMKLIDEGIVGFHDRLVDHIPIPDSTPHPDYIYLPANELMDPSYKDVRISELLTYTARFGNKSTARALWSSPRKSEACDNNILDASWLPDPNFRCERGYQNSCFGLLGMVIAAKAGLSLVETDSQAYREYLRDLWLRDSFIGGMICGNHAETAYYEACGDQGANCEHGFREFTKDGPLSYCSSGRWIASAEILLQLLAAIRYGTFLSKKSHALFMSQELKDKNGKRMPIGWNGINETEGGGLRFGKAGGGDGVKAYIMHFPRGIDAVIMTNTSPCNGCGKVGDTLVAGYEQAMQVI